ncbi:MAG: TRAP transporter substrate-binding protein DctP [Candidatus Latescibacterota bacterium]
MRPGRRSRPVPRLAVAAVAAVFLAARPAAPADPQHLLKIACVAPQISSWTRALEAINAEVREQTGGAVGLRIYAGGQQGDDPVVLRKIGIGHLQGGAFTGPGLGAISRDILALQMPFLFENYDEVDYVLERMDGYYRRDLEANGFALLGWTDIGFVHILSREPMRSVEDVRGRKVWRLEDEPITQAIFRRAGVTSVPLFIPDVLQGLQTNMVDVVYAPPHAAIVLQWFTRANCVTEVPINYTLAALLVSRKAFDALDPAHQQILLAIARRHLRELTLQTRRDNQQAMQVMQDNGLELVSPTPEDVAAFRALVTETVPELVGKAFSSESYGLVQQHLQDFRRHRPGEP